MVAKESPGEIASDTAAALLAAGAGAVVAGPGGALVGAGSGPVLTAALRDVVSRVTARRMRRSGEAFSLAAVLAGLPEEELAARIATNDRLAELASRVLAFVQDVSLADKRRALAVTLARAAQGEQTIAELDRAMVLAAALASLDAPHLRVMVALKAFRGFVPVQPNPKLADGTPLGMTIPQIDAATGLDGLGGAVVHGLISAGLAEDVVNGLFIGAESQHPFALTNLGRELLSVIEVATVDA